MSEHTVAMEQKLEAPDKADQRQKWYVYLLKCGDGSFYCGITTDIRRRLDEHNGHAPGGAKYTRGRRPVTLAGYASMPDKSSALRAELKLKKAPRRKKLDLLKSMG